MSVDSFFSRMNPLISAVLRSPVHWLLSPGLMLLTVTGRRSGRRYTFPVGYQRDRDGVTVMISEARHKSWWRNLREPGPVELRIRGRTLRGEARLVEPGSEEFRKQSERTLRRMPWLARVFRVVDYDRSAGLSEPQHEHLAREIAVVRIDLDGSTPRYFEVDGSKTTWHEFRPVDMAFVETAEKKYVIECEVAAPLAEVWEVYADPTTWSGWFPGVERAHYRGDPPYGVGTIREARVDGQLFEEVMVAWQEGVRWAYYVSRCTVPLARAQLEVTEFERCQAGTRLRWILATDPLPTLADAGEALPRILEGVFTRAVKNLEGTIAREQAD